MDELPLPANFPMQAGKWGLSLSIDELALLNTKGNGINQVIIFQCDLDNIFGK